MRVVVVAESWSPAVDGVTRSVARVCEHLARRGHECLLVAPEARYRPVLDTVPTVRVPAVRLPGADLCLGLPSPRVAEVLRACAPDVVHLASPFSLGAQAARAADRIDAASVAVYQTDVAALRAPPRRPTTPLRPRHQVAVG
ncbi:glycosyltransferase [Pseudokineococcus sp. 1T1Z-3]|uniref:glycosyltransferase n=1 Tax=Pseudokineococcus sp. 1T1Z-3 TaxID=3132745 RepID=UPI0030ADA5A5